MVTEFRRGLPEGALEYLQDKPDWWREVATAKYRSSDGRDRPLLVALRDGYMNAYAEGQSVLKIGFRRRNGKVEPRCKIHRKYVLGNDAGDGYLVFDGRKIDDKDYVVETTLQSWIKAALCYASAEKRGVGAIVMRHSNVIDVEMGLPANEPTTPDEIKRAPRMDIVALERVNTGKGARLVFYEAKRFANSALRANDHNPEVFQQLQTYEKYVSGVERRKQVICAYREACRILRMIDRMRGVTARQLVQEVADGAPLELDSKPRLIVFDYAADKVEDGSPWKTHEDVLRKSYCLLMGQCAEDVKLPS